MVVFFSCDDGVEVLALKVHKQVRLVGPIGPEHLQLVIFCIWDTDLRTQVRLGSSPGLALVQALLGLPGGAYSLAI